MNSREKILKAVKANKPEMVALPELKFHKTEVVTDLVGQFVQTSLQVGSKIFLVKDISTLKEHLQKRADEGYNVANQIEALGWKQYDFDDSQDTKSLQDVDTVCMEGALGVAENAAIWVGECQMQNRLLPFICSHLVVLLRENQLVTDMHEAYRRIRIDDDGYGVFISGPSKTADIEQSLVIGAHGPLSLTVYLLEETN
ncbi:MAG: LUD domain-containing protein [Ignavibacteria bacterium]|nr:LUD domain-containing protein [Ignavibacteria bacterium]MBI3766034.1 LUD domain-containing protein [Ignavibacteriales bacterium]